MSLLLGLASAATAQTPTATTGIIFGTVSNPDGLVIGGADVTLDGPTKAHTQSDAHGAFVFEKVLPGIYQVTVSKGSYETLSRADIAVLANSRINVSVALQPATFTSLKEIGRVTSRAGGAGAINTSTAAVIDVPAQTFHDQGLTQVTRVLNETPGIVTTIPNFGFNNNGAYQSLTQQPQIRGGLPYETESLIDGHPISIGASGQYSPVYLNPYTLQSVEVVKGPGSMPNDINYSVGGSVNYRTLEPTRKPRVAVNLDYNSYGGLSTNFQATGSTSDGKLGYALNYGVVGQPGPFQGDSAYSGTLRFNATTQINGQPVCGFRPTSFCTGGLGPPAPAGVTGYLALTYPIVICCDKLYSNFTSRSELVKLRYNMSQQTSLTAAFLGASAIQTQFLSYSFPQQTFDPYNATYSNLGLWPLPATGLYTGSLAPGLVLPYATNTYIPSFEENQQGLFETELRTGIGKSTALFRYYAGSQQDFQYAAQAPGSVDTFTGQVWGLLPTTTAGVFKSYNGDTATFTQTIGGPSSEVHSHFSGYSGEIDMPVGNNLYTLSADRTRNDAYYFFNGSTLVPGGASQGFTTLMARGSFTLTPNLTAMLGNYFVTYSSHFTPDGGLTWSDVSHSFYGPRLAMTWQPQTGTSVRLSAGSSIAPPYLSLINTQGGPPVGNNQGAVIYYFQTANNGNITPETAFSYDIGADRRFANDIVVSADMYRTTLHGQFLNSWTANGTFTATSGPNIGKTRPLYIVEVFNLGQSRYEGIELAVHRAPAVGWGFVAQGALIRAYTYGLPAGFYDTGNGPNTTNLGVMPNANFTPTGNGYNGIGGRVPYAQGYGEISYRAQNSAYFRFGSSYYGNNNSYNAPPFFIVSATGRYPLGNYANLQVTGDNLTGSLSAKTGDLFGGLRVPLANGNVGLTTLYNVGPTTFHVILEMKTGK